MALYDRLMTMGRNPATNPKTLDDTIAASKLYKRLVTEYNRTTKSANVEERQMCHTLWLLVDPKTKAKAEVRP